MMRTATHKLVYYIGQTAGELYDLVTDPNELHNLWDDPAAATAKNRCVNQLLAWLATSTYYNAGYKAEQARTMRLRWPDANDAALHGANMRPKQVAVL